MHYIATADTDVGIVKKTNQDSLLIKQAVYDRDNEQVLLAVVCDGMGGLAKGELASATVIREFSRWFDEELPYELQHLNLEVIGGKWTLMLKQLNAKISQFGLNLGVNLGTTFTGMLFAEGKYLIVHVGDTRAYHINKGLKQLTIDQSFVEREVRRGNMTPEQARVDSRRNLLLQCVGASRDVEPEVIISDTQEGVYLLCSDGFRHQVSPQELAQYFDASVLPHKQAMHSNAKHVIELVKSRGERDNVSVLLVKTMS